MGAKAMAAPFCTFLPHTTQQSSSAQGAKKNVGTRRPQLSYDAGDA